MNILFLFKITIEFIKTLRRDFSNDNETRALTELCTEARRQLWSKNKQLIFNVDGDEYKHETEEEKNARKQNNKEKKQKKNEKNNSATTTTTTTNINNNNNSSQIQTSNILVAQTNTQNDNAFNTSFNNQTTSSSSYDNTNANQSFIPANYSSNNFGITHPTVNQTRFLLNQASSLQSQENFFLKQTTNDHSKTSNASLEFDESDTD